MTPDPKHADGHKTSKPPNLVEKWTLWILTATLLAAAYAGYEATRLADSTDRLVIDAQETAKRQLRAYVSFTEGTIENCQTKGGCRLFMGVKNTGQTPAYNLTCYLASEVRDIIPPKTIFLNATTYFHFEQTGTLTIDLGAQQEWKLDYCDGGPSVSSLSVPSGKMIYAWGVVKYRDTFQRCMYTAFIGRYDGSIHFLYQTNNDPEGQEDCDSEQAARAQFP